MADKYKNNVSTVEQTWHAKQGMPCAYLMHAHYVYFSFYYNVYLNMQHFTLHIILLLFTFIKYKINGNDWIIAYYS